MTPKRWTVVMNVPREIAHHSRAETHTVFVCQCTQTDAVRSAQLSAWSKLIPHRSDIAQTLFKPVAVLRGHHANLLEITA